MCHGQKSVQCAALFSLSLALVIGGCHTPKNQEEDAVEQAAISPRVISLAPAITDIIIGLGAHAHLVGVTSACHINDVPIVGHLSPDPERILMRAPDLVISGAYNYNRESLSMLRSHGLNVMALPLNSLTEISRAITVIGDRLKRANEARDVVNALNGTLTQLKKDRPSRQGASPRVLLVYGISAGYVYSTGGGDHIADILDAMGAVNVTDGGPVTVRIALEQVIGMDPDVILHIAPTDIFPDAANARKWWADVKGLRANTDGKILVWPDNGLATPGTGLASQIRQLAQVIYEE